MENKYERIIVAVDGSEAADKAFEKAVEATKRNDATLIIAHVIDTVAYARLAAHDDSITKRITEEGRELLASYEQKATRANLVKTKTVLELGSPKTMIAQKIAPEVEADLIMIGASGLNAVERFMIGSVSERTVRDAKCDVLIIK